MLIVCGALVNGPYSLITTAVSADLVRGLPPWGQGITLGGWSGPLCPGPFPPCAHPRPWPAEMRSLKSFRVYHHPPFLSAPSPSHCSSRDSPLLVLGSHVHTCLYVCVHRHTQLGEEWLGWCCLSVWAAHSAFSPGDSPESEGQREGTVHGHGHHRRHGLHRSVAPALGPSSRALALSWARSLHGC